MSLSYMSPEFGHSHQQSLRVEAVPAPFEVKYRSTHAAGTFGTLDFPRFDEEQRPDEFAHDRSYPGDPWSRPLTSESHQRNLRSREEARRPPPRPLYAKRSLPNLKRTPHYNSNRINKAVRSDSQFKGLLHLQHVGPEPDENGPPPYAAELVQAAVLRKMAEVRKKNPHAVAQGCFIQLQGIPTRWLQRGYHKWTDAPADLLKRLPPPDGP